MKKTLCAGIFSLLCAAAVVFALSEKVGAVSYMVGAVNIKKAGTAVWKPARMNQAVSNGDAFQTAKAEVVEITLSNGSVVRISEQSEITINCPADNKVMAGVNKGKVWANIKKLSQRGAEFEVTSGTATAAIRGTVFAMNNNPDDSTTSVKVYDGKVDVGPGEELKNEYEKQGIAVETEGRKEIGGPQEIPGPFEVSLMDWVSIVKGQQIDIQKNGKYNKFRFDQKKDAQDEWVKFNQERDKVAAISHE
ncbi:MAG: hypothetical protein A2487_15360 [Candidatus Raymondbacteria bacterium RifOxyC12_full_50_8]|uniref:FecR protein domain-containing protein n=1 Tax=Candidatus Raymondbacteria bacterium RIFOXYD12_FULL_49_13 TaxID=1817890 RepID=A0A1F7F6U7_UNCRA|nr:MAG: hypothetical protein A2350_06940 [Candidatus Raymondbacteria bacterium RifOxyB12_full_50_8]OGJ93191.1 MAG: hypothetical protein A2248_17625 [Candidatus Raymondbacteria bacterium RIFOXYA2_FULL_49_16]OGJ94643.1 MAG: hypothetical protein A2487_15360 [Candidatus Raymondbacteria bacterium RifOxyC12_full_50_8]OGK02298.1 MAG: hypothetical protein A2519_16655 [Candidatus Raymondbacteria bacterium RIFOXYD12_FULL_49_13]OGP44913.1 MAG: hypothetical protein A2324_19550 [Candidatus Raymondbacteria b